MFLVSYAPTTSSRSTPLIPPVLNLLHLNHCPAHRHPSSRTSSFAPLADASIPHEQVPLDHWNAAGEKITIFAREVVAYNKVQRQLPYLLYLQGGPGFEAPRPTEASGWLKAATNHFRVILLDQRGTGRSTPVTAANLSRRGDAKAQADYLMFFRANSIVADCEVVRQKIVPANNQGGKWSLLGQSFGGFCCLTYLSFAPHGLTEVMLTGGVPPLVNEVCGAEQTYRALFKVRPPSHPPLALPRILCLPRTEIPCETCPPPCLRTRTGFPSALSRQYFVEPEIFPGI